MKVQISGLGAICASGQNLESIFQTCLGGLSSVGDQGLAEISAGVYQQLQNTTPAELAQSKGTLLGFHSFSQALQNSNWNSEDLKTAGFVYATTTGKIDRWEKVLRSYDHPTLSDEDFDQALKNQPLGAPHLELAKYFDVQGPKVQIASSCSASLQALAVAFGWLQTGRVQRCIVGSSEIHSDLTRVGFNSLRLITKSICRPFDKNRTGINLGEGSAFLLLEKVAAADSAWGYLEGAGLSSDAFHPTSPHPEGKGSFLSMEKALKSAGLTAEKIDWVYAHGTGSQANDLAEAQAINAIFKHKPFVTSTKSIHGHTLGACGALESALGLFAMKKNSILPNATLNEPDPQINLNLPTHAVNKEYQYFLKNSLGFGGINVSVIFSGSAK